MEESKIHALLNLLSDSQEIIWQSAYNELQLLPQESIETLKDISNNYSWDSSIHLQRFEEVLEQIKFKKILYDLEQWKLHKQDDLLYAIAIICTIQYEEVTYQQLNEKIEEIRLAAWLEFHYQLTSFEKVRLLNFVMFQNFQFKGNEQNFLNYENNYINKVLETRLGNPLSLCVIYILVAQRLNVPIFGVNLPKHFLMVYMDDKNLETPLHFGDKPQLSFKPNLAIQFYINAYNGGGLVNMSSLYQSMLSMNIEPKEEYFNPCTNMDIVIRMLKNIYNSYLQQNSNKAQQIQSLLDKFTN